jgi:hypothetical protein
MVDPPLTTVADVGAAVSEKVPEGLTTKVAIVVLVRPPPTPVMVSVLVPVGVNDDVDTVRVEEVVAGFVEKPQVAPLGTPVTLRATGALNPPTGVIVTE